jgi:hypothetical protein
LGNIPLPALSIRAPEQQPDPVTRYMQLRQSLQQQQLGQQQIQASQQENQLRQMQLNDQQVLRSSAKDVDWTDPGAFNQRPAGKLLLMTGTR